MSSSSSSSSFSEQDKDAKQEPPHELHPNEENNSVPPPLTFRRGVAPLQVTLPTDIRPSNNNNIASHPHVTPSTTASASYSFPISQRGMSRHRRGGGRVSPLVPHHPAPPPPQHHGSTMPPQASPHDDDDEYAYTCTAHGLVDTPHEINATMASMDAALALGRQAILRKQENPAAAAGGGSTTRSSHIQRHYSAELASAESMLALSKSPPRKIKDSSSSSHEEASKRGNALPICEEVVDGESSVRRRVVDESNPTTVSTPTASRPIVEPRLSSGKKRKERIAMPPLLPSDVMVLSQTFKRQRNDESSDDSTTSD